MLFGPKLNTVFKSRWNALFWAAGVLLTAYCSVPSPDTQDDTAQTAATLTSILGKTTPATDAPAPKNPWTKDEDK